MKSNEIWKPIKGFEGLYEVSNTRLVKALPRWKINNRGKQLTKEDLDVLEEVINEEIHSQIESGYKDSDYVKTLRNLLKKLDLKEIYNFDK